MTIQAHMPHLSTPQATVLALWSLGMVRARSCALTAVSAFLATWLKRKEPTVRQQLRECCYEARAKRGSTRCALAVESCFVPLLAWVVDQWEGTQLALALDATTLGTRLTDLRKGSCDVTRQAAGVKSILPFFPSALALLHENAL